MAERQTIIERVALYIMELRGAEEVERDIEAVDIKFTKMAIDMEANRKLLVQLGRAFKDVGRSLRPLNMEGANAVRFLEQYAIAATKADEVGDDLSLVMYAQSDAGQKVAESFGLIKPAIEDAAKGAGGLRDGFNQLNVAARALLRIFVGFKVLVGIFGIFRDMAEATFNLQAELSRLRAVVAGVSDQIEGDAGTWEEWLARLYRLRDILPLINMTDLARGLRLLTGVLGPLGLTANEIERVTGLVGQMATLMGTDFPNYMNLFIGAMSGAQRSVGPMGIDLRDGSQALHEYAESLGFVWEELNTVQKQWARLGFFVKEAEKRTVELTTVMNEQWAQLEELRKKREDILAQSPQLIDAQIKWAEALVIAAEKARDVVGILGDALNTAYQLMYILLYITKGEEEFAKIWEAHEEERRWQEQLEWLDTIKEGWQEIGEEAENLDDKVKDEMEGAADAAEDFADRMEGALQQAGNALRSYQRAVASAGIRLSRRLTDIVRNLEEKLADLESRFELRRSQLIARFEERRADLREEGAEKEEELREDLNKRLQRMEEDHLLDMQELREDYLLDLNEAARKRDAVSMRRIQQRYILEKKQRERDYGVRRRRAIEDYKEQIDELRKAREEQERELERSLERQLRELQENYERQQEEARLNAERQREDALRNYQEQLNDLWRSFQDRLETILINLMEEEGEWEDHLRGLLELFGEFYEGDLDLMSWWLTERAKMLHDAWEQDPSEAVPSEWRRPPRPHLGMAQGGMGIVRQPTQITVGEAGPELFAAWPVGQRMPRAGIDVRLTVDGTQQGMWSGDFENQVIRIFREVLEEAGV